ncbi:SpoIIE family protein phosphatase [Psychromonas sp. Urea-02u-13]|uniref:SpoIIE family protein phosphatase n=1 Tax=Psychromonas sp. Urea-02u-13 TaxID=2058326 RepID=UPI000C338A8F|nr:SpoIIE family protein phosphatase [Psychromonas sp. Urea-02u-13]PKG37920.1 hypothetical protein CXF74_16410 [Psychromonas sp. Urea-02u-13]
MTNALLTLQAQLTPQTPRQMRHALQGVIELQVAKKELQYKMLLCLSEALTNLLDHAKPTPIFVHLTFQKNAEGWALILSDDSLPWDPTCHLQDAPLTEFSDCEGGRGVALMHAQSDAIDYVPANLVNNMAREPFYNVPGNTKPLNHLSLHWLCPILQSQRIILLVEDNLSLCRLYQAYLSQYYTVVIANSGYQAIQILQQQPIHLVLSDIKMPQMNGLSLRKKINQQPGCELIPFIFLTGESNQMMQSQAAELGIDDYLFKPINKTDLLTAVKRVFGRSAQVYQQLTNRIDKQITSSLTPTLPEAIKGWRLQVASRNTGAGGGDLLLHKSHTNSTHLLVTDIMGHNDSAKFFSHAYAGYLHGLMLAMPSTIEPGDLLAQLSDCAMKDQLLSQITLTCCAVQLAENGHISLASAGHPAPLLISDEKVEALTSGGALPGLIDHAQYDSNEFVVQRGQRIALFTDGLFESAKDNIGRDDLREKITATLLATLALPIKQALQQVMAVFDQLTESKPNDDALLLLMEPSANE